MNPSPETPASRTDSRRLLTYLAAALMAGGMPAHEVQDEVRAVARELGFLTAQVVPTPTNVQVALETGEPATVESIDGTLRLDQLASANAISRGLRDGTLSPMDALLRLRALRAKPHRYDAWAQYVGGIASAVGIALILQPAWWALLFAAMLSPLVVALVQLAGRHRPFGPLLPSVAAFAVALAAFVAARHGLVQAPLRTLLPPLAVLLPGGVIVTGLSELAAGAMIAGTSRLGYGTTQLLMFALGIGGAVALVHTSATDLNNVRADNFGLAGAFVGVCLVTIGITLMESVSFRLFPAVFLVIAATFGGQVLGQSVLGAPLFGAFLGATAASFGSATLELVRPEVSRIVVFLPSFWLLVPGSLGLMSLSQLGSGTTGATDTMMLAGGTVLAIALGVIVGSSATRILRKAIRVTFDLQH